jgi:hypothetical protein
MVKYVHNPSTWQATLGYIARRQDSVSETNKTQDTCCSTCQLHVFGTCLAPTDKGLSDPFF